MRRTFFLLALLAAPFALAQDAVSFSFAIIGDRTGSAQPGVYQHTWRDVDRFQPAFAINVGDSIQGGDDSTAADQWEEIEPLLHRKLPFYLVPGNHDIWSPASAQLWRKVTGRDPHYSFDFQGAHITVLDNSPAHALSDAEMQFLEADLAAHKDAHPKLVFFHRPTWLTPVLLQNPDFPLHKLARKYGVDAYVSGHVHRFARWNLEGVEYLLMGSSAAHLGGDKFLEGWFFSWVEGKVENGKVQFIVHELPPPDGEGRVFRASVWQSGKLN